MYFVSRHGSQQGPHSLEEINRLISAGQLGGADLAWQEGMAEWQPLSSIPGIVVAVLAGPPPLPGGPPAVRSAYTPPQANVFPQGNAGGPPSNSGMAVASMVLGILSLVLFFTHIFALIMALLAVIFGHVSRGNIRRSQGRLSGAGMGLAGLITGYIAMLVITIAIIVAAFFIGEIIQKAHDPEFRRKMERMQKDFEKDLEKAPGAPFEDLKKPSQNL